MQHPSCNLSFASGLLFLFLGVYPGVKDCYVEGWCRVVGGSICIVKKFLDSRIYIELPV